MLRTWSLGYLLYLGAVLDPWTSTYRYLLFLFPLAVVAIGGEGTLAGARRLADAGLPVVGVPKTIDNDLNGTDYTFGFDTAVINGAVDAVTGYNADEPEDPARIIWVDSDGYETLASGQEYVLTSVIKKMGAAVENVFVDDMDDKFTNTPYVGTLENGGVDLAPFHDFDGEVSEEMKSELEATDGRAMSGLLLTYPVHQATDILFCQANLVPVGKDQLPHLEQARLIAQRFDKRYGRAAEFVDGDVFAGDVLDNVGAGDKHVALVAYRDDEVRLDR